MAEALEEAVIGKGRPFLGICVGMQLMATAGLEHGRHDGFGWIAGEVVPIATGSAAPGGEPALKIPHMGWNELHVRAAHPLLAGLGDGAHVYFVHGYHFAPAEADRVLATTDYGSPLAAVVGRANMVGTQFHPEKSQAAGLALIRSDERRVGKEWVRTGE